LTPKQKSRHNSPVAETGVLPWFLGISALAILTGGALTASEALVAEDSYQRAWRGHQEPRRRARSKGASTSIRVHVEAALKPVAAPGSVSPKPVAPANVSPRPAPVARPAPGKVVAPDARLQGILVGMGFKVPEAKDAIGKIAYPGAPFQDQIKEALGHLSK
jgi:hypothetical protein